MQVELPGCHRYLNRIAPTPLVSVRLNPAGPAICCKLEFLNPSGSTKDRIARYTLEKAWRLRRLRSGDRVVVASSGSTSIALALACAQMALNFLAVMPEGESGERIFIICAHGGEVKLTSRKDGIRGAIAEVERLGAEPSVFLPRQFANPDNAEAHHRHCAGDHRPNPRRAGRCNRIRHRDRRNAGRSLHGAQRKRVPVLARPINLVTTPDAECCSFSGLIPGVAEALSSIFVPERIAGLLTVKVRDEDDLANTRDLIGLGFPVGPSSGLNYRAAVEAYRHLGDATAQVTTVFPDRIELYFTTELFKPFA